LGRAKLGEREQKKKEKGGGQQVGIRRGEGEKGQRRRNSGPGKKGEEFVFGGRKGKTGKEIIGGKETFSGWGRGTHKFLGTWKKKKKHSLLRGT